MVQEAEEEEGGGDGATGTGKAKEEEEEEEDDKEIVIPGAWWEEDEEDDVWKVSDPLVEANLQEKIFNRSMIMRDIKGLEKQMHTLAKMDKDFKALALFQTIKNKVEDLVRSEDEFKRWWYARKGCGLAQSFYQKAKHKSGASGAAGTVAERPTKKRVKSWADLRDDEGEEREGEAEDEEKEEAEEEQAEEDQEEKRRRMEEEQEEKRRRMEEEELRERLKRIKPWAVEEQERKSRQGCTPVDIDDDFILEEKDGDKPPAAVPQALQADPVREWLDRTNFPEGLKRRTYQIMVDAGFNPLLHVEEVTEMHYEKVEKWKVVKSGRCWRARLKNVQQSAQGPSRERWPILGMHATGAEGARGIFNKKAVLSFPPLDLVYFLGTQHARNEREVVELFSKTIYGRKDARHCVFEIKMHSDFETASSGGGDWERGVCERGLVAHFSSAKENRWCAPVSLINLQAFWMTEDAWTTTEGALPSFSF